MKYYIADQHFGHSNMIKFENRPFKDSIEMNQNMVNSWNSVVKPEDEVFILGDFAFMSGLKTNEILKSLKGTKYLIKGNHDSFLKDSDFDRTLFKWIKDYFVVYDGNNKIVLCHYPIAVWDCQHHGAVHFYGHVHGNDGGKRHPILNSLENAYNVGVDVIGYFPKTAEQIMKGI